MSYTIKLILVLAVAMAAGATAQPCMECTGLLGDTVSFKRMLGWCWDQIGASTVYDVEIEVWDEQGLVSLDAFTVDDCQAFAEVDEGVRVRLRYRVAGGNVAGGDFAWSDFGGYSRRLPPFDGNEDGRITGHDFISFRGNFIHGIYNFADFSFFRQHFNGIPPPDIVPEYE